MVGEGGIDVGDVTVRVFEALNYIKYCGAAVEIVESEVADPGEVEGERCSGWLVSVERKGAVESERDVEDVQGIE